MSDGGWSRDVVRSAYAAVANEYAARHGDDLAHLELDRRVLDIVAMRSRGRGPVLDVGCGPAQLAEYLLAQGADAVAIDFSTAMLDVARARLPRLAVLTADLRALPVRSGTAAGLIAFYVLQHLQRDDIRAALSELRRCVVTDGVVALAVHEGQGEYQVGAVTATLFGADELAEALRSVRFEVETIEHRSPLPHERQGPRVYLVARAY